MSGDALFTEADVWDRDPIRPPGFIYDWGDFGCDDCTYGPPCADGPHSLPEKCPEGCNDIFLTPVAGNPEGKGADE